MPRCARTLLKARAAVDAVERNGASSLLLACQNGHDACVELLLEHSADPNLAMAPGAEDGEGQFTPLITAAKNGRATVVRTLLQAGAHRDAVTINGATPLVLFCSKQRALGSCRVALMSLIHMCVADGSPNQCCAPSSCHRLPPFPPTATICRRCRLTAMRIPTAVRTRRNTHVIVAMHVS